MVDFSVKMFCVDNIISSRGMSVLVCFLSFDFKKIWFLLKLLNSSAKIIFVKMLYWKRFSACFNCLCVVLLVGCMQKFNPSLRMG